jgi:hypothetical protein
MNELDKKRITKIVGVFCENRIPPHVRNEIKLIFKIRGNDVNIIESRPHWQNKNIWTEMLIAKIRHLSKCYVLAIAMATCKWKMAEIS